MLRCNSRLPLTFVVKASIENGFLQENGPPPWNCFLAQVRLRHSLTITRLLTWQESLFRAARLMPIESGNNDTVTKLDQYHIICAKQRWQRSPVRRGYTVYRLTFPQCVSISSNISYPSPPAVVPVPVDKVRFCVISLRNSTHLLVENKYKRVLLPVG